MRGFYFIIKPEIPEPGLTLVGKLNKVLYRVMLLVTGKLCTDVVRLHINTQSEILKDIKVKVLDTVLSREEAGFIYREHGDKPHHQANLDYLCSGKVKIVYVTECPGEDLGLKLIQRQLNMVKGELRKRKLFQTGKYHKRYNLLHVPDSIDRATEDLEILGLINESNTLSNNFPQPQTWD